jgi:PAS domain S-box-containing protein
VKVPSDGIDKPIGEPPVPESVRVSELSYRRLFEAAQDGILILHLADGRITDVNPFLQKLLGFSHEEMVGKTVGELSPFKDVVSNKAMLERLQEQGYVRYEDLPLETRDGRHIAVEFVSNVYQAGDKQVIQCNIRDITRRKKSEDRLSLLHTCISHLSEIIMVTEAAPIEEPGPRIIFVNEAFERITGYTPAEAIGRSPRFLQGEKTDRGTLEEIREAMLQHRAIRRQIINYRKDGTEYWLDIDLVPIFGPDGLCTHFAAIERDVTEERTNAEQLRWKTALLEAQLESSIDGILIVDTEGRQVLQNRRMSEIWDIPAKLVEAKDEAAQIQFAMNRTMDPGAFITRVNHLYDHPDEVGHDEIELKDGTVLDRYSAPIHDRAGRHYGRIWSFRDITERRKLEARFVHAQKMESIGRLAGGVAHDFNNILTAIVGNVDLATMEAGKNPALLGYLDEVSKAANRATDLVKQILTFSRVNPPDREAVAFADVVLEALRLLRASLPAAIRIQTEVAATPPVLAHATAIHQVVMNLGTNGWHAIGDRPGTLKVEIDQVEVDEGFVALHPGLEPGPHVRLSMSDTGCGMDRATADRIFDPFFTTKPMGQGTGLGLSVVHGIMQSHHGAITVYSRPGEGTTFRLYFPALYGAAKSKEVDSTPIPRGRGERILFVDDEPVLTTLGKRILDLLGYHVTAKNNALEALDAVRREPGAFDLVVTDLNMPSMDGTKFAGQLLRLQPNLPIILTTGFSSALASEKIKELGIRELLDKPSNTRTLGEAVRRVLNQAAAEAAGKRSAADGAKPS